MNTFVHTMIKIPDLAESRIDTLPRGIILNNQHTMLKLFSTLNLGGWVLETPLIFFTFVGSNIMEWRRYEMT